MVTAINALERRFTTNLLISNDNPRISPIPSMASQATASRRDATVAPIATSGRIANQSLSGAG
jgi:hypothetical protein